MKKFIFLMLFAFAVLHIYAQQVFRFADHDGRIANVSFSSSNMFIEQGGIIKAFSALYENNNYNWVSSDGCTVILSNDMTSMMLYVKGSKYLFKMQPPNYNYNYNYNNYQPYNNQGGYNPPTTEKQKCGYCNGTGRIDDYVATYGNTEQKWCSECGKYMSAGHCHGCKICPSCRGTGYR